MDAQGNTAKSEALKYIVQARDDGVAFTLGDLYRSTPKYPWTDYIKAVDSLISEGLLVGKGDGFVVNYSLTSKGRIAIGKT